MSYHAGDDIIAEMPPDSYDEFLGRARELGVGFNSDKQLYAAGRCEWLRRMYYPNGEALRSLARGIANAVAGNWGGLYRPKSDEEARELCENKISIIEARGGIVDDDVRVVLAPGVDRAQVAVEVGAANTGTLPGVRDAYMGTALSLGATPAQAAQIVKEISREWVRQLAGDASWSAAGKIRRSRAEAAVPVEGYSLNTRPQLQRVA